MVDNIGIRWIEIENVFIRDDNFVNNGVDNILKMCNNLREDD